MQQKKCVLLIDLPAPFLKKGETYGDGFSIILGNLGGMLELQARDGNKLKTVFVPFSNVAYIES